MSFVSVTAMEQFISVMSDGRAVSWRGDSFEIIPGVHKKFLMPTAQTFVAFAGRVDMIEKFLDESCLRELRVCDYGVLAVELQASLRAYPYTEQFVLIIFGGINSQGKIEICAIGSTAESAKIMRPQGEEISYSFLYDSDAMRREAGLDDEGLTALFIKILRELPGALSFRRFQFAQRLLNHYVAANNRVVDNELSGAVIVRQGAC